MKLYQSHIEEEFKPFQWVGPRNTQLGSERLGPISKREANRAMVKYATSTLSRIDPWPERNVPVQRRTERPPEAGRPTQIEVG